MPAPLTNEAFRAKTVEDANGCWRWWGYVDPKTGYGKSGFRNKVMLAHRASYLRFTGEIPDGLYVLHECDVRDCVNPNHLFLGDHQANEDDMVNKERQSRWESHAKQCRPRGRALVHRVLTDYEAVEIHRRRVAGESGKSLAEEFGVSRADRVQPVQGAQSRGAPEGRFLVAGLKQRYKVRSSPGD